MLNKAIAFLLTFAILIQGGTKLGIHAYFQLNQEYIAKVLCINKDKPKLHCNGKCFLAQKLKTQEEQEKKAPVSLKTNIEVNLFCSEKISFTGSFRNYNNIQFNEYYLLKEYPFSLSSIFHPPAA